MAKKTTFRDILRESFPISLSDHLDDPPQAKEAGSDPPHDPGHHLTTTPEPEQSAEEVRAILRTQFPELQVVPRPEVIHRTVPDSDPVPEPTVSDAATVSASATVPGSDRVKITSNFFTMDNDVFDKLPELQTPAEQLVYRYLYRIAYGWHRQTCFIGLKALSRRCNMSKNTVRAALDGLESKGHVKALEVINEKEMKGTIYRVFLPCEIPGVESPTCFHRISF